VCVSLGGGFDGWGDTHGRCVELVWRKYYQGFAAADAEQVVGPLDNVYLLAKHKDFNTCQS
jgi:hypothetical protein